VDFGTADTSIYRIGNLIVRWTEIYVPETIYLVLISATINFAQRFAAFLVTCTVRVNVCTALQQPAAPPVLSPAGTTCCPPPVHSYRVTTEHATEIQTLIGIWLQGGSAVCCVANVSQSHVAFIFRVQANSFESLATQPTSFKPYQ
jgi:hypothetical protein